MSLYDEVYKKLKQDLHIDDYNSITRGFKKQIIDLVIKDYENKGMTDASYVTNRVKDRFGLGFDPYENIYDKVLYHLEHLLDYTHDMKHITAQQIFKNEFETIQDMVGENPVDIAKQMIGQFRYKLKYHMKLKEAKSYLNKKGYILEHINKEEVSPDKDELITELLQYSTYDDDLTYEDLAMMSIDDLEEMLYDFKKRYYSKPLAEM